MFCNSKSTCASPLLPNANNLTFVASASLGSLANLRLYTSSYIALSVASFIKTGVVKCSVSFIAFITRAKSPSFFTFIFYSFIAVIADLLERASGSHTIEMPTSKSQYLSSSSPYICSSITKKYFASASCCCKNKISFFNVRI